MCSNKSHSPNSRCVLSRFVELYIKSMLSSFILNNISLLHYTIYCTLCALQIYLLIAYFIAIVLLLLSFIINRIHDLKFLFNFLQHDYHNRFFSILYINLHYKECSIEKVHDLILFYKRVNLTTRIFKT